MTHSQENVTDLPERVLLVASGPQKSSGHFYLSTSDETGAAIYVPESRALKAEAGRDALRSEIRERLEAVMCDRKLCGHFLPSEILACVESDWPANALTDYVSALAALRAERDALVPLIRAVPDHLCCEDFDHRPPDRHRSGEPCQPYERYRTALTQARAILAREGA